MESRVEAILECRFGLAAHLAARASRGCPGRTKYVWGEAQTEGRPDDLEPHFGHRLESRSVARVYLA